MTGKIGQTEKILLDLVANALFHAGKEIPDSVDWQAVYEESKRQTVTALAYQGAELAGKNPDRLCKEWKESVIAAFVHGIQVAAEHHQVDEMMGNAGIPYVILKGCASAFYYPDPSKRLMGDVDFLVKESDLEQAGEILRQEGFVPWEEDHICHVVYRKDVTHLEMHFEPSGMPHGEAGALTRSYLQDVMEKAEEVLFEGEKIKIPAPFHHGLILLLHTVHHMLGEGIGLRHLCDWAVFSASFSDGEFREIFEPRLKEIGLWKFACILSQTAEQWLGCPHRGWTGKKNIRLTEQMIEDIFTGGNFGQKKEGRVYETYLISSRGKDGVGNTSMLRQLGISMNEMVATHWPKARRNKFLLLPGWIYFGGRYMIRICRGKRQPLHVSESFRAAGERRKIYREFGLYEAGEKKDD